MKLECSGSLLHQESVCVCVTPSIENLRYFRRLRHIHKLIFTFSVVVVDKTLVHSHLTARMTDDVVIKLSCNESKYRKRIDCFIMLQMCLSN